MHQPKLTKFADRHFKEIVDRSFMGNLVFDRKTLYCVYANKRALEITGFEGTSLTLTDLSSNNLRDGQRTVTADLLELQGTHEDLFIAKASRTNLIVQAWIVHLSDDEILFSFQDMTFQKKLQREILTKQTEIFETLQALEKQNTELRDLDRAKDRFIALTSHELRTPISAIIATAQFIHDGLADGAEEVLQHVEVMLGEGNHLLEMVNDILDFQKIQMGKFELFVEEIDIVDSLKHSLVNMEKFAQTKLTMLTLDEPGAIPKIYCDPIRIAQVFYNVLSNGVKFSPEKSKVVVSLTAPTGQNLVRIAFRDFGPGISKDQEKKVFNEFETIENIRTHHKGTGLGMPICKRLMESIGGRIYFESELGQGTTFYVEIPTIRILEDDKYRKRSASADLAA